MQSFLDVTFPPLLLLAGVCAVIVTACVFTAGRLRLWNVQRHRLTGDREALSQARDALASIISETMEGDKIRALATTAYENLNSINPKGMERE